jgi:hypothetical protein
MAGYRYPVQSIRSFWRNDRPYGTILIMNMGAVNIIATRQNNCCCLIRRIYYLHRILL